jgi:arsenite/tail-anchored protein-transporting ATPase
MSDLHVEAVDEIDHGRGVSAPEYVLYGGKGGVGKTTMAAATALASAREGTATLVVSTDPAHSLSDVLDRDVPAEPDRIDPECPLYGVEIDPADEEGDFFGMGSPLAGLGGVGGMAGGGADPFGAPMPGADEAAALRLLLRYLDDERFERVVVDTAPTGHTLRLLELPERLDETLSQMVTFRERLEGMFSGFGTNEGENTGDFGFPGFNPDADDGPAGFGGANPFEEGGFFSEGGPFGGGGAGESDSTSPFSTGETDANDAGGATSGQGFAVGGQGLDELREFRDRIERLRDALADADRTDFRVVVVPEKTSVVESRRLLDRLDDFGVQVGTIVVNRVMEDIRTVLDLDGENEGTDGPNTVTASEDHTHDGDDDLIAPRPDSCPFCRHRLDSQMSALGEADDLFRGHTVKRVPLFAAEIRGEKALRVVGACLS